MKRYFLLLLAVLALLLSGCAEEAPPASSDIAIPNTAKPVIYLYPEQPTEVEVKLDFEGRLAFTYPAYNDGWRVTAYPDGRLINRADGSEHYYLFWDGFSDKNWSFTEGFCVAGSDTEAFLINALSQMGLTPREYNDFIVYWLPELR
ncbi:MAG: hypothetical protein IJC25_02140, partial [Clostridia bacterium]|nr:hypothetical protein [Clostridia bacterium]